MKAHGPNSTLYYAHQTLHFGPVFDFYIPTGASRSATALATAFSQHTWTNPNGLNKAWNLSADARGMLTVSFNCYTFMILFAITPVERGVSLRRVLIERPGTRRATRNTQPHRAFAPAFDKIVGMMQKVNDEVSEAEDIAAEEVRRMVLENQVRRRRLSHARTRPKSVGCLMKGKFGKREDHDHAMVDG